MDGLEDRDPCGCAAGRAMAILGERWTFLILHEAFHGVRRFSEMQRNLGIARNILSVRLQLLVRTGILEKRPYRAGQERFEYRLSASGRALYPAVVAISQWGEQHLAGEAAPHAVLRHRCGQPADPILVCAHCGEELDPRAVTPEPASVPA
jgi:DNA-binding HxlR family transcriptional regulator